MKLPKRVEQRYKDAKELRRLARVLDDIVYLRGDYGDWYENPLTKPYADKLLSVSRAMRAEADTLED